MAPAGSGRAVRPRGFRVGDRRGLAGHGSDDTAVAAGLAGWRDRGAAVQGAGVAGEAESASVGPGWKPSCGGARWRTASPGISAGPWAGSRR
jgi:hypothetical protein